MDEFATPREKLMRTLRRQGITDDRVLAVIASVPRERFVPREQVSKAYHNLALPIGQSQTISQPYIVALMTQALQLTGDERVLEIGTGSGYQTAVLSKLCDRVVSIERIPELSAMAAKRLSDMGCEHTQLHVGDGTLGWNVDAPYDAILVTAGAPDVPSPLYNQLTIGGRLVIPVGDQESQELKVIEKREFGPHVINAGGCRFVRLIGDAGWEVDLPSSPEE
ncbi:MAG: protein-L-isoaspartate(D-aspartate) O-methyltransferase [Planctomycetaceae bacterium]|nr:protein-L-isoaspartate(D-aspartate) O-methyltransferase [Planctomycetaceae bacterium]